MNDITQQSADNARATYGLIGTLPGVFTAESLARVLAGTATAADLQDPDAAHYISVFAKDLAPRDPDHTLQSIDEDIELHGTIVPVGPDEQLVLTRRGHFALTALLADS